MTNLSRKAHVDLMVRCQISANMSSFLPVVWNHVPPYFSHLHLISFKRLSDLFYFCFISFQLLFNILQNLLSGCHQFFNLWVLAFFVCKKESFVQKCTFGGWIWPATLVGWFCDSYLFAILYSPFFFYNSLFLEMAVQDEQSIQNNDHICSE